METNRKILLSIDDGGELDLTIADMCLKYNIPTVFYIPKNCQLSDREIRNMTGLNTDCLTCQKAKYLFDFGAHTMTHPEDMKRLSPEQLKFEVEESKKWLEGVIQRPVTRFCYPSGRFNEQVKEAVKNAGFKEARTTGFLSTIFPEDPLETKPTIHVHPDKAYYGDSNWKSKAHELLDKVIKEGGRFEIWCHSWELEKFHMWEFFEDFLIYMDEEMTKINYKREI